MIIPIQLWKGTKYLNATADQQSNEYDINKVCKSQPEWKIIKAFRKK
jgi:hypothetical protein